MEYNFEKREIVLNRNLSELDKFVIDFCRLLDNYVLVSGYVSILFGRSRSTEDVDLLIPELDKASFEEIWNRVYDSGFECINTSKFEEAFEMLREHAIRFSRKNKAIPNMEFKIIQDDLGRYSLDKKLKVLLNGGSLFISPLEMQIAYKLFLGKSGNEKDIEDAKHLYDLFKEKLNNKELLDLVAEFKAEKEFELIKNEY